MMKTTMMKMTILPPIKVKIRDLAGVEREAGSVVVEREKIN
jgi:hypothetical protein